MIYHQRVYLWQTLSAAQHFATEVVVNRDRVQQVYIITVKPPNQLFVDPEPGPYQQYSCYTTQPIFPDKFLSVQLYVAGPDGFEPPTIGFEDQCSSTELRTDWC